MTKAEAVKQAAIDRIGCPYVMGGTGRVCSPEYREARAAQYPKYASQIERNCPRLHGSASNCKSCKWADPQTGKGRPCYDCAQLALACMAAADIPLVSGANSQWIKTQFQSKGTIGELPADKVALVFRDDGGKMGHVGVYMGDGTVIHARGHAYGVVRNELTDVNFSHFGIPVGLYDNGLPTVRRGNSGEYVELLQKSLIAAGYALEADGKFGSATEQAVKDFQQKHKLTVDGICGRNTWAALEPYIPPRDDPQPEPDAPPQPQIPDDDDPDDNPVGYVLLDLMTALEIRRSLKNAVAILENAIGDAKP